MTGAVETADEPPRLVHQALVYDTDEGFLAATVPFCLQGVERDNAVLVVTTPANIELLRDALGSVSGRVEFVAAADWYDAPGRTLAAYHRYINERAGRHRRIRVIGEPVWQGRDALEVREWTRYESVANVAFAASPVWSLCPYDARVLPSGIIESAYRTHPQVVTGSHLRHSTHYTDPATFDEIYDREPAPPPEGRAADAALPFDADLTQVRAFVAATAASLGLPSAAAGRLVFAVNEVATNALRHGGGAGWVELRRAGHKIVCDVSDPGRVAGRFLGYLPPGPAWTRGHGLWIVRQLCDLVEIRAHQPGTLVRLHLNLA